MNEIQNLQQYILNNRYKKVFFLQMWSMRSHTDGKYNLLLDGNFNATIHDIYALRNDVDIFYVTMPVNIVESDFVKLHIFLNNVVTHEQVRFIRFKGYGANAHESRKLMQLRVNEIEEIVHSTDAEFVISDFELSYLFNRSYKSNKVVYRFNIGYHEKFHLKSMLEFEDRQVQCVHTERYVFLQNQLHFERLSEFSNVPNVIVGKHWFHDELFKLQYDFFTCGSDIKVPKADIFFPYRISDTEYNFTEFVNVNKDKKILITDVNSSYDGIHENVIVIDRSICMKELYLIVLFETEMMIPYTSDPTITLHQTILELMSAQKQGSKIRILTDKYDKLQKVYNDMSA